NQRGAGITARRRSSRNRQTRSQGRGRIPHHAAWLFRAVRERECRAHPHQISARTMPQFGDWLWSQMKRPVLDRTGMTGKYDFYLERPRPARPEGGAPPVDTGVADLFSAVQGQLGLKLSPDKGEFEVLVVDHAERTPTGN